MLTVRGSDGSGTNALEVPALRGVCIRDFAELQKKQRMLQCGPRVILRLLTIFDPAARSDVANITERKIIILDGELPELWRDRGILRGSAGHTFSGG